MVFVGVMFNFVVWIELFSLYVDEKKLSFCDEDDY